MSDQEPPLGDRIAAMSDEAVLARYRELCATRHEHPLGSRERAMLDREWTALGFRARPLEETRRLEAMRLRVEVAREETEAERLGSVTEIPWLPPRRWIEDGSWAQLSSTAIRVLVPIMHRLRLDGKATWVSRATLCRLSGRSRAQVSAGISELRRTGWIRVTYRRRPESGHLLMLFKGPPPGERRAHVGDPQILRKQIARSARGDPVLEDDGDGDGSYGAEEE